VSFIFRALWSAFKSSVTWRHRPEKSDVYQTLCKSSKTQSVIYFRTPCTCFPRHTSNITCISPSHINSLHTVGVPLNNPAKCYLVTSVLSCRYDFTVLAQEISVALNLFSCFFCAASGVTYCFSKHVKIFHKSEIPPHPPTNPPSTRTVHCPTTCL
jgi:hypothetical protein